MKAAFVFGCLVLAVACGGGDDGGTPETGYVFLQAVPSEETLCSFVVGETTMGQVMDVLGEPTHYSESPTGSLLQYWIEGHHATVTEVWRTLGERCNFVLQRGKRMLRDGVGSGLTRKGARQRPRATSLLELPAARGSPSEAVGKKITPAKACGVAGAVPAGCPCVLSSWIRGARCGAPSRRSAARGPSSRRPALRVPGWPAERRPMRSSAVLCLDAHLPLAGRREESCRRLRGPGAAPRPAKPRAGRCGTALG
jgi:hypothetical protein